jgi:hypothetical protein
VVVVGAGLSTTAERLGAVRTAVDTTAITRANEPNLVQALAARRRASSSTSRRATRARRRRSSSAG